MPRSVGNVVGAAGYQRSDDHEVLVECISNLGSSSYLICAKKLLLNFANICPRLHMLTCVRARHSQAEGEAALRAACDPPTDGDASSGGCLSSYSIVRPGQLIGGPYDNNYYLGTLTKLDRPARSILLWDDSEKANVEVCLGFLIQLHSFCYI